MQVYTIQASGNGWVMFRAGGVVQRVRSLAYAKMLAEDTGATLRVLDRDGLPMEAGH
jgi:hypothetical protein